MIDPNAINTVRVGQLPSEVWSGTDNLPHEVGTDLKRGTVAGLATYIARIIDASAGLAFNPLKISDGQTLPETTVNEWIIVGQGTYLQTGGFANVVCTDDINIVISDGTSWSLGFGIAVDGVDTSQFVKLTTNQTIDGIKTFVQPITLPNDSTVQEGNIGGISLVCSIAKELNWKEGVLRSYNQSDVNSKANPIIGESPITYVGQEFKDLINFSTADPITGVISIEFEGDLRAMNTAFHYENTNYRLYLYDLDNNILGIGKYDSVTYNDVDLSVLDLYDVENIKSGSTINAVVRVVGREIDNDTLATIEEVNRMAIPYTGTPTGKPITGDLEFLDTGDKKIFSDKTEVSNSIVAINFFEGGIAINHINTNTGFETFIQTSNDGLFVESNNPDSKGIYSSTDFSANITDLDYTQKIYVDTAISDKISYKLKATYALMLADGTPTVPTIYSITNDEDKSYNRSTYLWKPDGKREWIATTPDN